MGRCVTALSAALGKVGPAACESALSWLRGRTFRGRIYGNKVKHAAQLSLLAPLPRSFMFRMIAVLSKQTLSRKRGT